MTDTPNGFCFNCGAKIPEESKYCDGLCKHGFMQRQFREMQKENEELRRKLNEST